jgi:hypothetical protein
MPELAMTWGNRENHPVGHGLSYLLPGSPRCYVFSIEMGVIGKSF